MNKKFTLSKIALLILISSTSFAADNHLVAKQTAPSGVTYIAGGVSEEQSQQFAQLKPQFNTQFTFAEQGSGAYLADIKVNIVNAENKMVLDTLVPGPFLYVNLPNGTYIANVSDENQTQRFKFKIASGQKTVHSFYFKQP